MDINRDKLYHGVLGLAIGDALGVPAEFINRTVLKKNPIIDMECGGYWNQLAGTWSDDTAMTLATVDSLNKSNWELNDLTYHLIMSNFELWYKASKFASFERRFDIGNTCREAIMRYSVYGNTETCGLGEGKCGNGSLMRILPAIFLSDDEALKISRLTHNNKTCDTAILAYIHYIKELLNTKDKSKAMSILVKTLQTNEEYNNVIHRLTKNTSEDRILSTGYVVDTLEAAIWCINNTDSYEKCVLTAVNLGDDADTVGAVAGGIAGLYYGINEDNGIPQKWIAKLRDLDTLKNICLAK